MREEEKGENETQRQMQEEIRTYAMKMLSRIQKRELGLEIHQKQK